jgi:hypothetical protein
MDIPDEVSKARRQAHVVVHPVARDPAGRPFRSVDVLGTEVGRAYAPGDVPEFMRRAGLDTALFEDPDIVEWRGDGPHVWT